MLKNVMVCGAQRWQHMSGINIVYVPIKQVQNIFFPCRDINIMFKGQKNTARPAAVKVLVFTPGGVYTEPMTSVGDSCGR